MKTKATTNATSQCEERSEAEFSVVSVDDEELHVVPTNLLAIEQRRRSARIKVELNVNLESDHNFYAGFIENMSVGGVFIATHTLRAVGHMLEFSVHLPNSDSPIIGVGEVRWIREYSERSNVPPGMGVSFIRLGPGSTEAIEAFLAQREPLFFDE
ncbi:MAG TPA: TIGR02266 family protein [Polyangiaceae bacterium]